jgi:hypothetical protein
MKVDLVKHVNFRQAVSDLKECINEFTKHSKYVVACKTTNNFSKFKADTLEKGYIVVSREGCANTIYGSEEMNIKARVWHDEIHLATNLNFSKEAELKVSKIQEAFVYAYVSYHHGEERAEEARRLIGLDIAGQSLYYAKHKEFLDDQFAFIYKTYTEGFDADSYEKYLEGHNAK